MKAVAPALLKSLDDPRFSKVALRSERLLILADRKHVEHGGVGDWVDCEVCNPPGNP